MEILYFQLVVNKKIKFIKKFKEYSLLSMIGKIPVINLLLI